MRVRVQCLFSPSGCVDLAHWTAAAGCPQACELFILDLTLRGWVHAEDSRRRTLQRSDIAATIAHWEVLDFLVGGKQLFHDSTQLCSCCCRLFL